MRAAALAILPVLSLASCIDTYTPRMTAGDRAASRAEINAIDDENFDRRDRERRSQAEADRISNTGAPPVHYHEHRTYAPSYGW